MIGSALLVATGIIAIDTCNKTNCGERLSAGINQGLDNAEQNLTNWGILHSESSEKNDGDSKETDENSKPDLKEPGSYTNTHESGKRYHGAGGRKRSQDSGREKEEEYNDPHVATDWTPSKDRRASRKDEEKRIREDGGKGNPENYNKINSPGRKYLEQDGE